MVVLPAIAAPSKPEGLKERGPPPKKQQRVMLEAAERAEPVQPKDDGTDIERKQGKEIFLPKIKADDEEDAGGPLRSDGSPTWAHSDGNSWRRLGVRRGQTLEVRMRFPEVREEK